MFLAIKIERL